MTKRHYVVQKVGDHFVTVPADAHAGVTRFAWGLWGGLLTLLGLSRGGKLGLLMALGGGAMFWRGATGRAPSFAWLSTLCRGCLPENSHLAPSYNNENLNMASQMPTDEVDEASMESFPASDPPGKMSTGTPG